MNPSLAINSLKHRLEAWIRTGCYGPGIGAWIPGKSILVVGEKSGVGPGPKYSQNSLHAFFHWRGCSGWMNSQFEDQQINLNQLYFVNAFNRQGNETDYEFIKDLRPHALIGLGGIAQKSLKNAGIKCIPHYHPQYWKRFKSKEQYPFFDELKKRELEIELPSIELTQKTLGYHFQALQQFNPEIFPEWAKQYAPSSWI